MSTDSKKDLITIQVKLRMSQQNCEALADMAAEQRRSMSSAVTFMVEDTISVWRYQLATS